MKTVISVITVLLLMSCTKNDDKTLPELRDLTESVYTSVTIQPDSLYQVYSSVAGILDANLVEEGDVVAKGKPLIQIINNTPKLNAQNAKLSLDLARENYEGSAAVLLGIEDEINAATLNFKNDSINYFRQKNLWDQNIGSKVEFDKMELNYELSSNNLRLLNSKYDRTKNELMTAVKQAENNYRTSLINTKDFTLKSKIHGTVYALNKNAGELITTLEPLATMGSSSDFVVELLVDEVDIVKINLDQMVLITLDAYTGKVYEGKVSKILPKKDERNQTFKVEALFNEAPEKLYPGLSGEANIIIASRTNVLTIPRAYLLDDDMVKTDDGNIPVTLGLQNLDYVEVLSGIDETTFIYKPNK